MHIMGPGKTEPARLTPDARPLPDGTIIYPEPVPTDAGPLFSWSR
jgi:hypothetical protein